MQALDNYDEERWYVPYNHALTISGAPVDERDAQEKAVLTFSMQRFVDLFQAPTERALRMYAQMKELDAQWKPFGQALIDQVAQQGQKYEDARTAYVKDLMEWIRPTHAEKRRPWWKFWPLRQGGIWDSHWTEQSLFLIDKVFDLYDDEGNPKSRWGGGSITTLLHHLVNGQPDLLHFFPVKAYAEEAAWVRIQGMVDTCKREILRHIDGMESNAPVIAFSTSLAEFVKDRSGRMQFLSIYRHRDMMTQVRDELSHAIDATFQELHANWMPKRIDLGKHASDVDYVVPMAYPADTLLGIFENPPIEIFKAHLTALPATQPPVQSE